MEIKQAYKVDISPYAGLVIWHWINIHDQQNVRFIICTLLVGKALNLYIYQILAVHSFACHLMNGISN